LPAQVQRLADNVKDKTAATKNAFPALRTGLQALKGTAQETKGATNRLVAGEGEGQKGLEGYLQRLDESLRRELQAHRQSSRESFKLILTNVDDPVKASKDVMKTVSSVDANCERLSSSLNQIKPSVGSSLTKDAFEALIQVFKEFLLQPLDDVKSCCSGSGRIGGPSNNVGMLGLESVRYGEVSHQGPYAINSNDQPWLWHVVSCRG
jgi:ABC-type transporter Mla subunit MlaD